jgi:hypothetical protein
MRGRVAADAPRLAHHLASTLCGRAAGNVFDRANVHRDGTAQAMDATLAGALRRAGADTRPWPDRQGVDRRPRRLRRNDLGAGRIGARDAWKRKSAKIPRARGCGAAHPNLDGHT